MPSAGNCPNKTLVADHATLQLVMMSRHIESVRKSIFDDVSLDAQVRFLIKNFRSILFQKHENCQNVFYSLLMRSRIRPDFYFSNDIFSSE